MRCTEPLPVSRSVRTRYRSLARIAPRVVAGDRGRKTMKSLRIVVLSALAIWLIVGVGIGVLGMFLAGGYVKSPFENVPWTLRVTLVPTILAAVILSRIPSRFIFAALPCHLTALVTGYFTVVLTGSVFTVIDGMMRFGDVNIWGYFTWSWIYGLIFLPLSYPLCILLLRIRKMTQEIKEKTEPDGSANSASLRG